MINKPLIQPRKGCLLNQMVKLTECLRKYNMAISQVATLFTTKYQFSTELFRNDRYSIVTEKIWYIVTEHKSVVGYIQTILNYLYVLCYTILYYITHANCLMML